MQQITENRKVDGLGRVVLPLWARKMLDINEKDEVQVSVNGDEIMLKKV